MYFLDKITEASNSWPKKKIFFEKTIELTQYAHNMNNSVKAEIMGMAQIIETLAKELKRGGDVTPVMLESVSKNLVRLVKEIPADLASYECESHIF